MLSIAVSIPPPTITPRFNDVTTPYSSFLYTPCGISLTSSAINFAALTFVLSSISIPECPPFSDFTLTTYFV